jgi:hypothetical protein
MISPWRPIVAELPDLSSMLVKTYVNEIDISKVQVGQKVEIGVDAFPDKELFGEVTQVANIGEQMKNSTARVFEVIINVEGHDEELRPAMTTKNKIITNVLEEAVYVPLEALNTKDSIQFVYLSGKKQQVETGESSNENIVVTRGLKEGDEVYLVPPEGADRWNFNLLPENKQD